jgi:hypothetical protein
MGKRSSRDQRPANEILDSIGGKDNEPAGELDPELQRTLERVGPGNYAAATAHEFAVGRFSQRRRPRYAIT